MLWRTVRTSVCTHICIFLMHFVYTVIRFEFREDVGDSVPYCSVVSCSPDDFSSHFLLSNFSPSCGIQMFCTHSMPMTHLLRCLIIETFTFHGADEILCHFRVDPLGFRSVRLWKTQGIGYTAQDKCLRIFHVIPVFSPDVLLLRTIILAHHF